MRELTQNELALASGGHGFAQDGLFNAVLTGASVGGLVAGPKGAAIGGFFGAAFYFTMQTPTRYTGAWGRNRGNRFGMFLSH